MATLLTETTKKMLGSALMLEKSGAKDAAREICIKCVKQLALSDDDEDVLAFFYGESVYDALTDVSSAMEFALVAACAKILLGEMKDRASANNMAVGKQPWVSRHPQKSDETVVDFFTWLCSRRKEAITERDRDRFVNMAIAVKSGALLKTDDAVAGMYPMDILRSAATGRLRMLDEALCTGGYAF